jgi:hypothetical protein
MSQVSYRMLPIHGDEPEAQKAALGDIDVCSLYTRMSLWLMCSLYAITLPSDELFIQAGLTRPIDTCMPLLLVLYFFLDLLYRYLARLLERDFPSDKHTEG